MNDSPTIIQLNRYPGVKPFHASEHFLFFGRERDLEALNSLIFIKQTVVLYGKSGYGKSSLINAGIIPRLNQANHFFTIRFNNHSAKNAEENLTPAQTTKQRLAQGISSENDSIVDRLIPHEGSFWYWIKQNQLQSGKGHFIIFFDQFEELFTYPKEQVNEFSEQLSDLLYATLPLKFKKRLLQLENEENGNSESLVTEEEHDFLYEKPEVKVIFSIRSDRLSLLYTLTDRHPTILQNCYELKALTAADAKMAVTEPAKLPRELGFATDDFNFTENAVNKIIDSIADTENGHIETATLQIICRYVEETLVAERGYRLISENELDNITDIIQKYYETVLNKLSDEDREKAQGLIEDQLIDGNKRNPLSINFIEKKFNVPEKLLSQLEQSSLLRKERDAAGRLLYEVSHDSLISAINKVAAERRQKEEERRRKDLEDRERKEMELQIEQAQKRNTELLHLNRIAKTKSRIAFALTIVCISFTLIAVFFWQQAKKNSDNARKAQSRLEISTATLLMERGDGLMLTGDSITSTPEVKKDYFKEAKFLYDSAFTYLQHNQNDSLKLLIGEKRTNSEKKIAVCQ